MNNDKFEDSEKMIKSISNESYDLLVSKISNILLDAHKSGKLMESDMLSFHPRYRGSFWINGGFK
tara:strand:- start:952 stop:1146 length:195 start_codon:yes stop_codon:yes gene_type:complete